MHRDGRLRWRRSTTTRTECDPEMARIRHTSQASDVVYEIYTALFWYFCWLTQRLERFNIGAEGGRRHPPVVGSGLARMRHRPLHPGYSISTSQWTAVVRRSPSGLKTEFQFLGLPIKKLAQVFGVHRARFVSDELQLLTPRVLSALRHSDDNMSMSWLQTMWTRRVGCIMHYLNLANNGVISG